MATTRTRKRPEPKLRIEGLVFTIAPFTDGHFQMLGIASANGKQDELLMVGPKVTAEGLRAYARDFRMLADTIYRLTAFPLNQEV